MISRVLWPAGILLAAYFLYFSGLAGVGLLSVDEPRYAWIGRAMAESGDWISPRLYSEPWLEKPPLLYWLIAAGWKLGFRDEMAARFPIAVSALLFLAVFWWSLLREFGEEVAGRATAILSTAGGWLLYSHVAVTDIPLAATFGSAMLFAWRGQLLLAGLAMGLAVLAKGLVPVALGLPVLWWHRRRLGALILPVALMLAVAAPWYILCYQRHGRALIDELIVRHHFARFFDAKAQVLHPQPVWFYLPVLIGLLLPWSPLFAALRPRRLWVEKEPARFFLVWLAFGFAVFSASAGKLPGYLLPLLPPAAALLALALTDSAYPRLWLSAVIAVAAALYAAPNEKLLAAVIDSDGSPFFTNWGWVGLTAGLLFGLLLAAKSFLRAYATVALLMASLLVWAVPVADRHTARPYARMSPEICAEPSLHRAWRYGFNYYAQTPVPECNDNPPRRRWHASSDGWLYLRDASADPVPAPAVPRK